MLRYGSGDDGGKWVCGLAALQQGCIIYSLGSDGNFAFENSMVESSPCEIHTFDCTITSAKVPGNLNPRIHFHPLCLGDDADNGAKAGSYRSLSSLMAELGHAQVQLLKMDIEGYEFRVIEALFKGFLAGKGSSLPLQIAFEQHYLTNTEVGWGKQNPGLSAGDMAIAWVNLAEMGYVLVHREDQP
jgi:hypothetical protein